MATIPSLFNPGALFGAADQFMTLHREMNRLFEDVMRGTPALTGQARTGMLLAPSMDVSKTDKSVIVRAELPGVSEKDVEMSLDEDMLTIRAEKRQERREDREGIHFSERAYGTFQRSLRLPFRANPDQIEAKFENGVLTVTVPKPQQPERNRRIQVQGSPFSETKTSGASSSSAQSTAAQQSGATPAKATSPAGGDGQSIPGDRSEGGDEAGSMAASTD